MQAKRCLGGTVFISLAHRFHPVKIRSEPPAISSDQKARSKDRLSLRTNALALADRRAETRLAQGQQCPVVSSLFAWLGFQKLTFPFFKLLSFQVHQEGGDIGFDAVERSKPSGTEFAPVILLLEGRNKCLSPLGPLRCLRRLGQSPGRRWYEDFHIFPFLEFQVQL